MFTWRTLREGIWPIIIFAALGTATVVWCPVWWAPILPFGLLAFTISFFRDPHRTAPADPKAIVSPADGKVVEVRTVNEPLYLKADVQMVAIFLSVFDVHVQRSPIEGEIKFVQYNKGRFLDARNPQCGALNENRVVGIEGPDGFRVTVRQVAGLIARRIVGWAEPGTRLARGQHIGMIRFGSRVELYLPPDVEVTVKIGQMVKGAQDVIARKR
jgi:phosphatidylserine decarboxylase